MMIGAKIVGGGLSSDDLLSPPKCRTCHGKSIIFRKQFKVFKSIINDIGEEREIQDEVGGIDICPECLKKSEANWLSQNLSSLDKKKNQEQR